MSDTLQIGRVTELTGDSRLYAERWDADGETVQFTGFIAAALYTGFEDTPNIAEAKIIRAQLLGHVGEVIAVVSSMDPTINGYYRLTSAQIPMIDGSLLHGVFPVQLQLERVRNFASPLWESLLVGNTRDNGAAIVGAPFFAFPDGAPANPRSVEGMVAAYNRSVQGPTGAAGNMRVQFWDVGDLPVTPQWRMPPSDYYWGAATIEQSDGTNYHPVTGLQAARTPTLFRLQNGLVRCVIATDEGEGVVQVSHWDGAQWDAAKQFRFEASAAYVVGVFTDLAIIRNEPEEVIVRLSTIGSDEGLTTIDLALRRGDRWVRGYLDAETARQWLVIRDASPAEGADAITGGVRATSNDASGNRYVLASALGTLQNTSEGGVALPSTGTALDFGIGSEIGGTGASGSDAATGTRGLIEQYFAAVREQQQLAGR